MAKYRQLGQEYSFSESFLSAILISKIEGNTAFGLKIQFSNLKMTVSSIQMLASLMLCDHKLVQLDNRSLNQIGRAHV
jgi:hypothetical protein